MSDTDPIAVLIPWYAAGTLDAAEREKVESHLAGCSSCHALLARARSFRRQAPAMTEEGLFDHVEGHLLVQFAEQPDRLEADTRRFISTHLSGCEVCAGALEILQDLSHAPVAAGAGVGASPGPRGPWAALTEAAVAIWHSLSRTVLRPVPALIYLGALGLALLVVPLRQPGSDPDGGAGGGPAPVAITALPPVVRLPEEIIMRGDEDPPEPQHISLPAGAGRVVLELITSIDLDDLADPDAAFAVEIVLGDRVLHRMLRRGGDFDRRGRLQLLLDPRAFEIGELHAIRLLFQKPDDRRDGELVYRKSFRLRLAEPS